MKFFSLRVYLREISVIDYYRDEDVQGAVAYALDDLKDVQISANGKVLKKQVSDSEHFVVSSQGSKRQFKPSISGITSSTQVNRPSAAAQQVDYFGQKTTTNWYQQLFGNKGQ